MVSKLDHICQFIVKSIFGIILFFLLVGSFLSTSYITLILSGQKSYFLKDNLCVNVLFIALIIFVGILCKNICCNINWTRLTKYILLVEFVLAVTFVVLMQLYPRSDSYTLFNVVQHMLENNYSDFMRDGYMARYTNQLGYTFVIYVFSKLFGYPNFLLFEIINICSLLVFEYYLGKYIFQISGNSFYQFFTVLLSVLFIPLLCYVELIYGTLPGLAAALAAVSCFYDFYENEDKLGG